MLKPAHLLFMGSAVALCGCVAPPPSAPAVMALPSTSKNFAQFQQEDIGCRQTASQAIGVPPPAPGAAAPPPVPVGVAAQMQQTYDVTYTQCMYGKGNQVTAPPPPAVYAGDPYYGYYDPFYLAYGYGPVIGFGYGFGGRYYGGYGGGYHGGYGGGYGGFHGGGGGFHR